MHHHHDGSKVVLITCVLIHCFVVNSNRWLKYMLNKSDIIQWSIAQGIAYLLYPLFGWVADVYVSRYKIIKLSFVLVIIGSLLMLIESVGRIFEKEDSGTIYILKSVTDASILLITISGIGLYEANAIQFGMQQLNEASSDGLSRFIYWYYWSLQLGPLIIYYIMIPVLLYILNCQLTLIKQFENLHVLGWITLTPSVLQSVLAIIGIIFICWAKRKLELHQTMINPLKKIFHTLIYAWKHNHPEQRSALTYWENTIPSRIDLGKNKYGGPYTFEEVEDTKTFLRLILFMISLFGYFFRSDIHSADSLLIMNQGCSQRFPFLVLGNTEHIPLLIALIGLPIYQLFLRKRISHYLPNLMTRIGIGLFLCLVQEVTNPLLAYIITPMVNNQPLQCGFTKLNNYINYNSTIILCILANAEIHVKANGSCTEFCPGLVTDSNISYLLLLPEIIQGFSTLLVNLTVLEFICAQGPLSVKGLLIGIWYSLTSIQYLVNEPIDMHLVGNDVYKYTIYSGVKGVAIFASLLCYMKVCKIYQYRQRNEEINHQQLIEEQYERELLMNNDEEEIT